MEDNAGNGVEGKKEIRRMVDITTLNVVVGFKDGGGFIVPLTDLQGAFVLRALGFSIDSETGEPLHYTDDEMVEIYGLKGR